MPSGPASRPCCSQASAILPTRAMISPSLLRAPMPLEYSATAGPVGPPTPATSLPRVGSSVVQTWAASLEPNALRVGATAGLICLATSAACASVRPSKTWVSPSVETVGSWS